MAHSNGTSRGVHRLGLSVPPQTPTVDQDDRLVSPIPGLTATIYSMHGDQPIMVVHFVSYARVADTTTAHFDHGDYIVHIEGMGHPVRCRDLGLAPHGFEPCTSIAERNRYCKVEGGVRTRRLLANEHAQNCQCRGCAVIRMAC